MMDPVVSYPNKIAIRFAAIDAAVRQQVQADKEDMGEYVHIPIGDLATELGCRSAINAFANALGIGSDTAYELRVRCPPQPDPSHEALVARSLVEALRISCSRYSEDDDRDSLLDGLLRNNRWRLCLDTTEDAYRFAQTLVSFFHNLNRYADEASFRATLAPDLLQMIAQWVGRTAVTPPASAIGMAVLMFGSAWCDLRLDNEDNKPLINAVIWAERPPFMPGLLPAHLEADSTPLTGITFR